MTRARPVGRAQLLATRLELPEEGAADRSNTRQRTGPIRACGAGVLLRTAGIVRNENAEHDGQSGGRRKDKFSLSRTSCKASEERRKSLRC